MGYPTVHPTGVTIYDREKAYNGYTLFTSAKGALLINMNGKEVKLWSGLSGFPNKLLKGGQILGSSGTIDDADNNLEQNDIIQVDWDGHIVWKIDHIDKLKINGEETWVSRQNHDYEREGSSTGYYAPGQEAYSDHGRTIFVSHEALYDHKISDKRLLDDKIVEVDWDGNVTWTWYPHEHFDEFGFREAQKNALFRNPFAKNPNNILGNYLCINSLSWVGPNHWYEEGDERFHPENIIVDCRNVNLMFIISRETGKVVWKLGPDFEENEQVKKLGAIFGQHHFHMIPKGLPGEGNLLLFDNGGASGVGEPTPEGPEGRNIASRGYSRVIEFNPVTLELIWQYGAEEAGYFPFTDGFRFFSSYISSAQRLPNGNTLITEGADGKLFEVTPEHEVVWEYIDPYEANIGGKYRMNQVFRAYRVPYDWVPQLPQQEEVPVPKIDVSTFRVPGASKGEGIGKITIVEGVDPNARLSTGSGGRNDENEDNIVNFCVGSVRT